MGDNIENIKKYCELNNLNYDKTLDEIISIGFNYMKYGKIFEKQKETVIKTEKIVDKQLVSEKEPNKLKKEKEEQIKKDFYGE